MSNFYLGINGTNVVCNENYFDGYITAYPMENQGNISFFDKADTTETLDFEAFKVWCQNIIKQILNVDPSAQFTFFNKKMEDICSILPQKNISSHNDWGLISFLNDKYKIRNFLSKQNIEMLEYLHLNSSEINYETIVSKLGGKNFVVQSYTGAGGLTTHHIGSQSDIDDLSLQPNTNYAISGYQENLPVNSTLLISNAQVHQLPTSTQLIKNTGNFLYMGGDFALPETFNQFVNDQIYVYNDLIGKELQKLGYRGICGVDYIICPNGTVKFMELNPRYQGSSFILSQALKNFKTSIAKLNAECFASQDITVPEITIGKSFVNCTAQQDFNQFGTPDEIIKKVEGSTFRKIFNRSLIKEDAFEQPKDLSAICR